MVSNASLETKERCRDGGSSRCHVALRSELLITQASVFPKGKHDDLVDSMTQALKYPRDVGLAQTDEEVVAEENDRVTHRPRPRKSLHSC
jgi:hypothetical protein